MDLEIDKWGKDVALLLLQLGITSMIHKATKHAVCTSAWYTSGHSRKDRQLQEVSLLSEFYFIQALCSGTEVMGRRTASQGRHGSNAETLETQSLQSARRLR
jgi:hypothetical protein